MEEIHIKVLRDMWNDIVSDLTDLIGVTNHLLSADRIIISDHQEKVLLMEKNKGSREAITYLLTVLVRRPPQAFPAFLEALKATSQDDLRERILKRDEELHRERGLALPLYEAVVANAYHGPREDDGVFKYRVVSDPYRGVVLIINNYNVEGETDREGSLEDVANLQRTFQTLPYKVLPKKTNLKMEAMRAAILDFSHNLEHNMFDAGVLVVMSHGTHRGILGTDGEPLAVMDIFRMLDDELSVWRGKPLLLVLQACRGEKTLSKMMDGGKRVKEDSEGNCMVTDVRYLEEHHPEIVKDVREKQTAAVDAVRMGAPLRNSLVLYSSCPSFVSYRHKDSGSLLITKLCEELRDRGLTMDLASLLQRVCDKSEFGDFLVPQILSHLAGAFFLDSARVFLN